MERLPLRLEAPSRYLACFASAVEHIEAAPLSDRPDDPIQAEFRGLFVELYRLVWSLQRSVPKDEVPDLQLREHRDALGRLTEVTVTSARHAYYQGTRGRGLRHVLLSISPVSRQLANRTGLSLLAVQVSPVRSVLSAELRKAYGEPIYADERSETYAQLSFRANPDAFMQAVVVHLRTLGVRPGEAA